MVRCVSARLRVLQFSWVAHILVWNAFVRFVTTRICVSEWQIFRVDATYTHSENVYWEVLSQSFAMNKLVDRVVHFAFAHNRVRCALTHILSLMGMINVTRFDGIYREYKWDELINVEQLKYIFICMVHYTMYILVCL